MKPLLSIVGLCLVIGAASCGGNTADASSSGATGTPASSGSLSSNAPASSTVVSHEKLAALFPTIPGFKRETEPQGDTDTSQNVSRVQANYVQEGGVMGGLSLEMMDVSTNKVMLDEFREIQRQQGKTAAGTQKPTTIAGFPAYEEWTPEAGNGVLSVLLSDRFVVTLTGNSVGNVSVIYKAMDAIDLKKIAALR